jgi:hypothetical protein
MCWHVTPTRRGVPGFGKPEAEGMSRHWNTYCVSVRSTNPEYSAHFALVTLRRHNVHMRDIKCLVSVSQSVSTTRSGHSGGSNRRSETNNMCHYQSKHRVQASSWPDMWFRKTDIAALAGTPATRAGQQVTESPCAFLQTINKRIADFLRNILPHVSKCRLVKMVGARGERADGATSKWS